MAMGAKWIMRFWRPLHQRSLQRSLGAGWALQGSKIFAKASKNFYQSNKNL
jgi:hypothetical protein